MSMSMFRAPFGIPPQVAGNRVQAALQVSKEGREGGATWAKITKVVAPACVDFVQDLLQLRPSILVHGPEGTACLDHLRVDLSTRC